MQSAFIVKLLKYNYVKEFKVRFYDLDKKQMINYPEGITQNSLGKSYYNNLRPLIRINGDICQPHWGKNCILMQYAFEEDIKGTQIFVGDILGEKWKCEVYQNDEGTFMVKFHCNPKINKPTTLKKYLKSREKAGTSENDNIIIGNIYENAWLL